MSNNAAAKTWSLNYKLLSSVISGASAEIATVGLETKEFFVLAEIDQCPYPAELSVRLSMPKPTITVYLKSLEAAGFVKREIDPQDLRRHRLVLTTAGRKVMTRASTILSDAYSERLARLNSTERKQLQTLLEKLV